MKLPLGDRNGPSLLPILIFFFLTDGWCSMSTWLFVAKLYIMCGFDSA